MLDDVVVAVLAHRHAETPTAQPLRPGAPQGELAALA
ncbi:hypothetical protein SAMN06298212_13517 [Ruaniaceae bacterium KH17]|nr:hypothetical protein SAMN06298212_13517 [Ruaniaceae bacterium KH17]